jgi:SAM-dependent methyltransferase
MTTTDQVRVAPGNQDQYAAWDGDEGVHWAAHADFFDASVRELHRRLMEAAAVEVGERVLDLGCGNGQCTREAALAAGAGGEALGIDLSAAMLRVAADLARREGVGNVRFVQGDAQVHPFEPGFFDVALSRTGAMFFADQVAAFRNVARALRPGGRLALVSWRGMAENEWINALRDALLPGVVAPPPPPDAPTPFRHADPSGTRALLAEAGFEEVALEPLDATMYFGRDADQGFPILRGLLGWMVRDLDADAAAQAFLRLRELLRAHETPEGVAFRCAAWLITARRGLTG